MQAVWKGHESIVRYFLAKGADVHQKSKVGNTLLILASNRGHAGLARQLLERGCPINERNLAGNTALMEASREGHIEAVKLLLEKGADPKIRNNKRELAHTMVAKNRTDIQSVFKSNKGEWNWLSDLF